MNTKKILSTQSACDGCGGDLYFSPKTQTLMCEKCNRQQAIDKNFEINKHSVGQELDKQQHGEYVSQNKVFKCSNCGSSVILDKYEVSKQCLYCDTNLVLNSQNLSALKPDAIIPFVFDKEEACKKFRESIQKKAFLPNEFKKELPKQSVKGLYIPSFSFECDIKSEYNGELYNIKTYKDSEGNTQTSRSCFSINGKIENRLEDIIIESSSILTQAQLSGILPYKYEDKQAYNDAYIRGYNLEVYDTHIEECRKTYKTMADSRVRSSILSKYDYDGINHLNINSIYLNQKYSYTVLPIYQFKYSYKNKKYITYMNGQTGKVDSNVPRSGAKIAGLVIGILLAMFLPILLFIIFNFVLIGGRF